MSFIWDKISFDKKIYSQIFETKFENLKPVQSFITANLHQSNEVTKLNIIVEELFVNVVNYAYIDKIGMIKVSYFFTDDAIHILMEDQGVQFNPLHRSEEEALEKVKSMTPGGLGIFMVKKYADALEYAYTKKTNRLYIKKCI